MNIYTEDEIMELVGPLGVERFRKDLERKIPGQKWIYKTGDRVQFQFSTMYPAMKATVKKTHLVCVEGENRDQYNATYDLEIEILHPDAKIGKTRLYNVHSAYVSKLVEIPNAGAGQ